MGEQNSISASCAVATNAETLGFSAATEAAQAFASVSATAWTEFLSVVSHDIRAPLSVVLGAIGELRDPSVGALNDSQSFLVGLIQRSAERLSGLAEALSDVSRLQAAARPSDCRTLDLVRVVRATVDLFKSTDRASRVLISAILPDDPLFVSADAECVAEAVTHLMSNAVRFATSAVAIRVDSDGSTVSIVIEDDGAGFPPRALPLLIQPCLRLAEHGAKSRTGLGLFFTKAIAQRHGGALDVDNRRDARDRIVGARAVFCIPLVAS